MPADRRLAVAAATTLALAGAGALAAALLTGPGAATGAAGAACDRTPGDRRVERQLVRVPRGLADRPALVLAFHGSRGSGAGLAAYVGLDEIARREGFVVAYPDAARGGTWELNRAQGNADVSMTRRLIDAAAEEICIDRARVYATGLSNGAGFSARVGCELAPLVAAIAPVAGSFRAQDPCPRRRGTMPTLELHGRDAFLWTVPRLMRMTAARNGCTRPPVRRRIPGGAVRTT